MTADDLAALEAKMTPGPWVVAGSGVCCRTGLLVECDYATEHDRAGIAALRNHARLLIAALRVVEAREAYRTAMDGPSLINLRANLRAADAAFRAEREGGGA